MLPFVLVNIRNVVNFRQLYKTVINMKLKRERRNDKFTIDLQTLRNICTFGLLQEKM